MKPRTLAERTARIPVLWRGNSSRPCACRRTA